MPVQALNPQTETQYVVGVYKLKDKIDKQGVRVDVPPNERDTFIAILVEKVRGENNKVVISVISRKRQSGIVIPKPMAPQIINTKGQIINK